MPYTTGQLPAVGDLVSRQRGDYGPGEAEFNVVTRVDADRQFFQSRPASESEIEAGRGVRFPWAWAVVGVCGVLSLWQA